MSELRNRVIAHDWCSNSGNIGASSNSTDAVSLIRQLGRYAMTYRKRDDG